MGNMKGKNTQITINTVKIEIFISALDEFIHEIDTNSTDWHRLHKLLFALRSNVNFQFLFCVSRD